MSAETKNYFLSNEQDRTQITANELVYHFQEMGLQTNALVLEWVNFAEFEIIGQNGTVQIDVMRPDGNTTRCYLSHSLDPDRYVYLQVDSNIQPGSKDRGTEVHGIFPGRIKGISSSSHHGQSVFTSLNFDTEDGYIGITEYGGVILSGN